MFLGLVTSRPSPWPGILLLLPPEIWQQESWGLFPEGQGGWGQGQALDKQIKGEGALGLVIRLVSRRTPVHHEVGGSPVNLLAGVRAEQAHRLPALHPRLLVSWACCGSPGGCVLRATVAQASVRAWASPGFPDQYAQQPGSGAFGPDGARRRLRLLHPLPAGALLPVRV